MRSRPRAPHSPLPAGITGRRPFRASLIAPLIPEMGTDGKGLVAVIETGLSGEVRVKEAEKQVQAVA